MLGFSVWIEISLVLCGGIEIDLIFEWASISLNCGSGVEINFIVRDRILLGFSVGVESDLFLCGGSQLAVCGPKLTWFKCNDRLAWFLCEWWRLKLTRFFYAGSKSLGFSVSIEIDLGFV